MKKLILTAFVAMSLGSVNAQQEYKAYVVSNAHFDSQWNWTVQTSINEYVYNTLVQNLWLLDNYPDYVFNFEGGVKYQWMKEYYPLEYEKIKKYIAQGRWNIAGSSWDATDPNMPSPESFFRNILLGQDFYKNEFGVKSKDIFLPDCFGFGYALPTIAAHAGLIGFSTQKLQWRHKPFHGNAKFPFNFGLWQGVDGSRIMAALNAMNYTSRWQNEDISNNKELIDLAKSSVNNTAYRYYGTGDMGGSPTISSVASLEKGMKSNGPVKIISSRSYQLFEDYLPFDKHPELPVYKGELLMDVHGTGCYTSQAAMKRFNRRNEQLGDAAERSSVMADFLGGVAYPAATLDESWKRFIWHQFHDDLTGTSIPKAYTFSWNDELIAQSRFADIIKTATGSVSQALDTKVKGTAVVVYNSLSSAHKDVVTANVPVVGKPSGVRVFNNKGKEMPAQLVSYANGVAAITFAADAAPVSYSVYDVRFGKANAGKSSLKVTSNTLENSVYKITLNADGDISSIVDKRVNRELVKNGAAIRLAFFPSNESFEWPAWEVMKKAVDGTPVSVNENVRISVEENGPLCATLKVERKHANSTFVQHIRLTEGAADDRIDIINDVDWASQNALLKAEFPLNLSNSKATYDLGLGSVERGNNTDTAYEVCAQQWADLTDKDGSYGVSILNNCKYGWDKPNDNTLRLTLLHTPKTDKSYTYQDKQDLGHHVFTYSIVGHVASADQKEKTAWKADALNNPMISFISPKHAGKLGSEFSFVKTSTPQVAVKALKRSEDGQSYVVRLYELNGQAANNVEIEFPTAIESAQELNGIEEAIGEATIKGNKLIFSTTAYKPKTFGVKLRKGAIELPQSLNIPVALDYNDQAFTPDAFRNTGRFDKEGNSYSADLIGKSVVSDGITFNIAAVDVNNVVKCKKNIVRLPENNQCTKLYILASSVDKDRKATFKVDGKQYTFQVPYYSGFFGQWGQTGFSEGYVKDATLAYVGSHRHTRKGNEAYTFTYMFKFCISLPQGAKELELPDDENIAVFAATLSNNSNDDVKPACEMRALPLQK